MPLDSTGKRPTTGLITPSLVLKGLLFILIALGTYLAVQVWDHASAIATCKAELDSNSGMTTMLHDDLHRLESKVDTILQRTTPTSKE